MPCERIKKTASTVNNYCVYGEENKTDLKTEVTNACEQATNLHLESHPLESSLEPKTENEFVSQNIGAGDNPNSAASECNVENETKEENVQIGGEKDVIDISHGYTGLSSSLCDNNNAGTFNQAEWNSEPYTFNTLANSGNEDSTVLAYAWNPMSTTTHNVGVGPSSLLLAPSRSFGNGTLAPFQCGNSLSLSRRCEKSFVSIKEVLKDRHYMPSQASRQSHNEKERRRRSRMKQSCDTLRSLVPGVSEKTDKATVLEQTVNYLLHLQRCVGVKCDDYIPEAAAASQKIQFIGYESTGAQIPAECEPQSDHQYFHVQEETRLEEKQSEEQIAMQSGDPITQNVCENENKD
ncbi:hypothetical protein B4U79_18949 [Dinothrombium tinctorium]|uniref:BHLH domain-containing protein n=1 Tax=Dinothrombium tinctorium TaxID=1965070 RepID=A0A3S3PME4_9ACAR|nr:hypothetical protein B4U79_19027 [Dinothrombium tinctorium]RWS15570.1 hypothetical protein B4U79_18949 [Dinothrombium tinctorium]